MIWPDQVSMKERVKLTMEYFTLEIPRPPVFEDSKVLQTGSELLNMAVNLFPNLASTKLLFRASRDGFTSSAFPQHCDNIPNTITLISVNGNVFGGFANVAWRSSGSHVNDPQSFLFSLKNPSNSDLGTKFSPRNSDDALYFDSDYGPTFGSATDLVIFPEPRVLTIICSLDAIFFVAPAIFVPRNWKFML
jgi:hypothetical protein